MPLLPSNLSDSVARLAPRGDPSCPVVQQGFRWDLSRRTDVRITTAGVL
jgi:hypothetical protein